MVGGARHRSLFFMDVRMRARASMELRSKRSGDGSHVTSAAADGNQLLSSFSPLSSSTKNPSQAEDSIQALIRLQPVAMEDTSFWREIEFVECNVSSKPRPLASLKSFRVIIRQAQCHVTCALGKYVVSRMKQRRTRLRSMYSVAKSGVVLVGLEKVPSLVGETQAFLRRLSKVNRDGSQLTANDDYRKPTKYRDFPFPRR